MLRISSSLQQNDVIALLSLFLILNIFHTLFLLLILNMYLIARFDIVSSLFERVSTNWNAHPLLRRQNKIYLLQTLMQIFFIF